MASSEEFLSFILDQLSSLDGISYRKMMGEYILYFKDKIFGGIYDDRLLVKPVSAAISSLPDAPLEKPYAGAKEMILVENIDDRDLLHNLIPKMYDELPYPKKRKS